MLPGLCRTVSYEGSVITEGQASSLRSWESEVLERGIAEGSSILTFHNKDKLSPISCPAHTGLTLKMEELEISVDTSVHTKRADNLVTSTLESRSNESFVEDVRLIESTNSQQDYYHNVLKESDKECMASAKEKLVVEHLHQSKTLSNLVGLFSTKKRVAIRVPFVT